MDIQNTERPADIRKLSKQAKQTRRLLGLSRDEC